MNRVCFSLRQTEQVVNSTARAYSSNIALSITPSRVCAGWGRSAGAGAVGALRQYHRRGLACGVGWVGGGWSNFICGLGVVGAGWGLFCHRGFGPGRAFEPAHVFGKFDLATPTLIRPCSNQ